MRRLLAIALAAGPLAAGAQTAGKIYFDGSATSPTINAAQCNGAQATDTVALTWLITLENAATWPFDTSGEYKVYAASSDLGTTNPFCYTANGASWSADVVPTTPASPDASAVASSATVTTGDLAASAGYDCTANKTVYVCVLWYPNVGDTTPRGYAKGTVLLKVAAPGQPTVTGIQPGDGALNVKADTPDGASGEAAVTWRAKAVAVDPTKDGATHYSAEVSVGTEARISGLTNFVPYYVTAFSYSADGNESPESARYGVTTTYPDGTPVAPEPVQDAWERYKAAGGRDSGGCQAGGAGLLALVGAAAALGRLRRRP